MPYSANPYSARDLVLLSLLLALAVAIRTAENYLPFLLPLAGAKLGLANSITIIAFYLLGVRQTALLVTARIVLAALLAGTLLAPGFFIGAGGAVLSFFVMAAGYYSRLFSPLGIGLLGAAAHHCGQILSAALLMQTWSVLSYLPLLLLVSIPLGLATGSIANTALRVPGRKQRNGRW